MLFLLLYAIPFVFHISQTNSIKIQSKISTREKRMGTSNEKNIEEMNVLDQIMSKYHKMMENILHKMLSKDREMLSKYWKTKKNTLHKILSKSR